MCVALRRLKRIGWGRREACGVRAATEVDRVRTREGYGARCAEISWGMAQIVEGSMADLGAWKGYWPGLTSGKFQVPGAMLMRPICTPLTRPEAMFTSPIWHPSTRSAA